MRNHSAFERNIVRRLDRLQQQFGLPALSAADRVNLVAALSNVRGEGVNDPELRVLYRLTRRGLLDGS